MASLVVDAVKADRFYILTHDEWLPGITARTERMVNGQDILAPLRSQKDDEELDRLREAARMIDFTVEKLFTFIKPGMKERDIIKKISDFLEEAGCTEMSFSPIVASGPNASMPHYGGNQRVIEEQDVIILEDDCGTTSGLWIERDEGKDSLDSLASRIIGRYLAMAVINETTGETTEQVQRRQDNDIQSIFEQLNTGFTGTTVTHTFVPAQLQYWKGYDGTGIPEGILDQSLNRLYL